MESDYQAARLLWLRAGWLKNVGRRSTRETGLAKWFATVASERAAGDAVQVHGANGYSDEYPVGRFYRNCKGAVIYEGHARDPQADAGRLPARLPRGPADAGASCRAFDGGDAATPRLTDGHRPLARVPPRRRARRHRLRAHDGAGRPAARPITWRSRRCAATWTRCRSTARSSSARGSATRRRCSTSASASGRRTCAWASTGSYPQVDIAVDPLEGHESLRARHAGRDLRAGGVRAGRAAARARPLHGEADRRAEVEERGRPRRAGRRQPEGDRALPRPRGGRPRGRRAWTVRGTRS